MSRTELECPECGSHAPPAFVQPPPRIYQCDRCGARTPHSELRARHNYSQTHGLRGAPIVTSRSPSLVFIGSNTQYNGASTAEEILIENIYFDPAKYYVVFATYSSSGTSPINSCTWDDSASFFNRIYAEELGGVSARVECFLYTANFSASSPGFSDLQIAFDSGYHPKSSCAAIYELVGVTGDMSVSNDPPLDQTYSGGAGSGVSTLPSATMTDLGAINELAVAHLGNKETTANAAPVWGNGYQSLIRIGTNGGSQDVTMALATKSPVGALSSTASATLGTSVTWGLAVTPWRSA